MLRTLQTRRSSLSTGRPPRTKLLAIVAALAMLVPIGIGLGNGQGRLLQRRLTVHAEGRGQAARPRSASLWLPATSGGVELAASTPAPVVQLAAIAG